MNKQQFIDALNDRLCGLPKKDVDDRIAFYIEMIDDRIEEGLRESEAVADVGSVESIAEQIKADLGSVEAVPEAVKEKKSEGRKMKAWEIVLLAVGSPLWLSLALSALSVIISLYAALWSLLISLWAVFVSLAGVAIGAIALGIVFIVLGDAVAGCALIGGAIASAGLSIFMFFGCKSASKGTVWLTKLPVVLIKKKCAKEGR